MLMMFLLPTINYIYYLSLKKFLKKKFEISYQGELQYLLGLQVL